MRLVVFCLAVLSSNSDVVHVSGADVSLKCPAQFADNKDNAITCTVNKAAIDGVTCAVDQHVLGFNFKRRTEHSSGPLCDATYPCTSPAPVTATGTCGCTKQEGDIFTYTILFKANMTTDEGGEITCQICAVSAPALLTFSSDSCKNMTVTTDGDTSDEEGSSDEKSSSDEEGSSDEKGSSVEESSSNLGLIIGASAGGVVVVAMAIGTAMYCHKERSSGGHNVQGNTRSDTPPPAAATASHPADRGVAATLDVEPTEEEAGANDSEASEATDVSETSEEP
ncbi:uncharacterized protein [Littorina saxatilis]|uniref:Uncharacterized protein n=1 Tax=Littorina saxatilis TaxID=31220 RepID=A0AAN9GED6_9CAEN